MNIFYSNLNIHSIQPDYILSRQLLELLTKLTSPILDGDLIRLAGLAGGTSVVAVGVGLPVAQECGVTVRLANRRLELANDPIHLLLRHV